MEPMAYFLVSAMGLFVLLAIGPRIYDWVFGVREENISPENRISPCYINEKQDPNELAELTPFPRDFARAVDNINIPVKPTVIIKRIRRHRNGELFVYVNGIEYPYDHTGESYPFHPITETPMVFEDEVPTYQGLHEVFPDLSTPGCYVTSCEEDTHPDPVPMRDDSPVLCEDPSPSNYEPASSCESYSSSDSSSSYDSGSSDSGSSDCGGE